MKGFLNLLSRRNLVIVLQLTVCLVDNLLSETVWKGRTKHPYIGDSNNNFVVFPLASKKRNVFVRLTPTMAML